MKEKPKRGRKKGENTSCMAPPEKRKRNRPKERETKKLATTERERNAKN
jgi:hypothetical protein